MLNKENIFSVIYMRKKLITKKFIVANTLYISHIVGIFDEFKILLFMRTDLVRSACQPQRLKTATA